MTPSYIFNLYLGVWNYFCFLLACPFFYFLYQFIHCCNIKNVTLNFCSSYSMIIRVIEGSSEKNCCLWLIFRQPGWNTCVNFVVSHRSFQSIHCYPQCKGNWQMDLIWLILIWLTIHGLPINYNGWIETDLWLMTNLTQFLSQCHHG